MNSTDPSPNPQPQIPWSEDAEASERIWRLWVAQERSKLGGNEASERIWRLWVAQERFKLGGIGSMMVGATVASFNPQPQIPWSEDAGPELNEASERIWRAQETPPGLGGIDSMMVDDTVAPRVRRRRGAKPKISPALIKEAQEDLRVWGKPLRPYDLALQRVTKFLKRKDEDLIAGRRQDKTILRQIIIPLLPEDQKPKKRQPRKTP